MPLKDSTFTTSIAGGEEKSLGGALAQYPADGQPLFRQRTLTDGTGSGKAQKFGVAEISLVGGASVTIDLRAMTGPYGNVAFSSAKEFVLDNQSEDPTDVFSVGDDGTVTNPWAAPFLGTNARVMACPGQPLSIPSPLGGFAVDATHRNVLIKNLGSGTNAAVATLIVCGEGA